MLNASETFTKISWYNTSGNSLKENL